MLFKFTVKNTDFTASLACLKKKKFVVIYEFMHVIMLIYKFSFKSFIIENESLLYIYAVVYYYCYKYKGPAIWWLYSAPPTPTNRRTLVTWQASQGRARTNDSSPWKMLHLKEMYKQTRLFNIWDALYFTLNVQTDSVQVKLYLIIEPYFVYFYMLHEFNLPWQ